MTNSVGGIFGSGYGSGSRLYSSQPKPEEKKSDTAQRRNLRNQLKTLNQKTDDQNGSSSLLTDTMYNSTKAYGEALRQQRLSTKETSTKLSKLKYSYKNISSKILRSKTSTAARQVVGQAHREVMRLKREKMGGKHDAEEIEAAITHAKAMERIARKKVKHLEEEEMAKACGGRCADNSVEEESVKTGELKEERTEEASKQPGEDMPEITEASEKLSEDMSEVTEVSEQLSDVTSAAMESMDMFFAEVSEEMKDLLEEMELGALTEGVLSVNKDTDPADLEMMKIKHRNKEMKDMVKADAEYLKTIFDRYERMKGSGAVAAGQGMSQTPALVSNAAVIAGFSEPGETTGQAVDIAL